MKKYLAAALPLLLSCAANQDVTFSYSGIFKVSLPANTLPGGTVFYSDELSLKMSDGALISGKVVSTESEGLPPSFDIRQYPEYVLGIKTPDATISEASTLFTNSLAEIGHSYSLESLRIIQDSEITRYSLCKERSCLTFIVKKSFDAHILSINAMGYSQTEFDKLIKGTVHVN